MLLGVVMRFIHIASAITLLGGVFYACNLARAGKLSGGPAPGFKPGVIVTIICLVGAGLYNFFTKTSYPPGYHMVFGIKTLLALHIIAVAMIMVKPGLDEAKVKRLLTGVSISGIIVVLLSAVLRALSLKA